jgi:NAD(P)H-nitrite reductase large subunit
MSVGNGNEVDWTKVLREAGGPQNLSPGATAQVWLLQTMLREERQNKERRTEMSDDIHPSEYYSVVPRPPGARIESEQELRAKAQAAKELAAYTRQALSVATPEREQMYER